MRDEIPIWATQRIQDLLRTDRSQAEYIMKQLLALGTAEEMREQAGTWLDTSNEYIHRFLEAFIERRLKETVLFKERRYVPPVVEVDDSLVLRHRHGGGSIPPPGTKPHPAPSSSSSAGMADDEAKKKGRRKETAVVQRVFTACGCMARRHALVGNCLACGRIACEAEDFRICLFCGAPVDPKVKQSGGSQDVSQVQAEALRDRLVRYDRTSAQRTVVLHDGEDYRGNADARRWMDEQELEALRKAELDSQRARDERRLRLRVGFDFAGNAVVLDGDDALYADEPSCRLLPEKRRTVLASRVLDSYLTGSPLDAAFDPPMQPESLLQEPPLRLHVSPKAVARRLWALSDGDLSGSSVEAVMTRVSQVCMHASRYGATDLAVPVSAVVAEQALFGVDGLASALARDVDLRLALDIRMPAQEELAKVAHSLGPWSMLIVRVDRSEDASSNGQLRAHEDVDFVRRLSTLYGASTLVVFVSDQRLSGWTPPSVVGSGLRKMSAEDVALYWAEVDRLMPLQVWFAARLPACPLVLPIRYWAPKLSKRRLFVAWEKLSGLLVEPMVGRATLQTHERLPAVLVDAPTEAVGELAQALALHAVRVVCEPLDAAPLAVLRDALLHAAALEPPVVDALLALRDRWLPDSPRELGSFRANKWNSPDEAPLLREDIENLRSLWPCERLSELDPLMRFLQLMLLEFAKPQGAGSVLAPMYADRSLLQKWLDEGNWNSFSLS